MAGVDLATDQEIEKSSLLGRAFHRLGDRVYVAKSSVDKTGTYRYCTEYLRPQTTYSM